jgi:predicted O-methyltransferase YrrM
MQTMTLELPERRRFINGENTVEIGYPWLTVDSIIFLESVLRTNFKVLECGCGGSTVFFSKRCESVISIDTEKQWVEKVQKLGLENAVIECKQDTQSFLQVIEAQQNGFFDVVSVDSNPKKTNRLQLTNAILPKLKRFGFLILDNYGVFGTEKFIKPQNCIEYIFDDPNWAGKGTKILQIK